LLVEGVAIVAGESFGELVRGGDEFGGDCVLVWRVRGPFSLSGGRVVWVTRLIDLRLAVGQGISCDDDLFAGTEAFTDFDQTFAARAESDGAHFVSTGSLIDVDARLIAGIEHRVAIHGEDGRGAQGDRAVGVEAIKEDAALAAVL